MSKEDCRRLKSQICVLFVYKFVVFVLLLKTRTSWYWWWNFHRTTQHLWIGLLLSAFDFLLLLYWQESAFQFQPLKSSQSIFLTYFSVVLVKHDLKVQSLCRLFTSHNSQRHSFNSLASMSSGFLCSCFSLTNSMSSFTSRGGEW